MQKSLFYKEFNPLHNFPSINSTLVLQASFSSIIAKIFDHDFIHQTSENGKLVFTANTQKLNQIVENSENFDSTISSLEKMDSYLN